MHYHAIEMSLYEIALSENIESLQYGTYPFTRVHMLHACMNCMKQCFEAVFSLPLSEWINFPFTIWAFVGHLIVVLSKLSRIDVEGWDQEYVRSVLDFGETVSTLAHKLNQAKSIAENPSPQVSRNLSTPRDVPQFFSTLSNRLQRLKAVHDKHVVQKNDPPNQISNACPAENLTIPTDEESIMLPPTPFYDYLDEGFWNQFT